jgi:hypothetical protein
MLSLGSSTGLAFFELLESLVTYQACAIALMILAFIVSHMAVGVYDVIVTTLLLSAMTKGVASSAINPYELSICDSVYM